MIRKLSPLILLSFLAACGGSQQPNTGHRNPLSPNNKYPNNTSLGYNDRVPDFVTQRYEPFSRQEVVAIALREWRLFGQPVADDDPVTRPEPTSAAVKAERMPGLWERVGEYWWIGMNPSMKESSYTGKHSSNGQVFDFRGDTYYAWSAAFISYVMRIAGANERFPYSPNHSTYINAAASNESPILRSQNPASYAPQLGDMICTARGKSRYTIRYNSLPTSYGFPAHCGIVVATQQMGQPFGRQISIIGGNVEDAVALTHVPVDTNGMLADSQGNSYDSRYPWCTVLQVIYDAEANPDYDQ